METANEGEKKKHMEKEDSYVCRETNTRIAQILRKQKGIRSIKMYILKKRKKIEDTKPNILHIAIYFLL